MLEISKVYSSYGDLKVLFNISLHVDDGECVALLGSNGAGKTTLLSILSGLVPVTSGVITYNGQDLLKCPAKDRANLGISHIPQGRGIFGTLDVMDNLLMGGYCARVKKRRIENIEKAFTLFPKLKKRQKQVAGSLSGGEQQMLAIARALVMEPTLLMLDEPSLGLAPIVVEEVFETIDKVRKTGVSVLIIEQNLIAALSVAQRGYVIETGHMVLEGSAAGLIADENVKKAYLGI